MAKILELVDFHYYYGNIHSVKGVNLYVDEGEMVVNNPPLSLQEGDYVRPQASASADPSAAHSAESGNPLSPRMSVTTSGN